MPAKFSAKNLATIFARLSDDEPGRAKLSKQQIVHEVCLTTKDGSTYLEYHMDYFFDYEFDEFDEFYGLVIDKLILEIRAIRGGIIRRQNIHEIREIRGGRKIEIRGAFIRCPSPCCGAPRWATGRSLRGTHGRSVHGRCSRGGGPRRTRWPCAASASSVPRPS